MNILVQIFDLIDDRINGLFLNHAFDRIEGLIPFVDLIEKLIDNANLIIDMIQLNDRGDQ